MEVLYGGGGGGGGGGEGEAAAPNNLLIIYIITIHTFQCLLPGTTVLFCCEL